MDPFAVVVIAGFVAMILWVALVGKLSSGQGMEQFGLRSGREISESREALEAEDLDQMLAAANARRRKRGERDVTVEDLERRVWEDQNEMRRRREALAEERSAGQELDELLDATNARRRARGKPERTREDVEREFGGGRASSESLNGLPQTEPGMSVGPDSEPGAG